MAVQHVEEHGNNFAQACRALGYPCAKVLRTWVRERKPELLKRFHPCKSKRPAVKYDIETKRAAVHEFAVDRKPIYKVAAKYGVSRASISNWTKQMLGANIMAKDPGRKKSVETVQKTCRAPGTDATESTKLELEAQVEELRKELHMLRMETDALKKAAEILKKLEGIDLKRIRNSEKADVIDALRHAYQLNALLSLFGISKSSYFYCRKARMTADKYQADRLRIRSVFEESSCCYGYRRIHATIKHEGICLSEKVVRRIMREEHLIVKAIRRKKYSSYKGEITPAVPNIIKRDFHADAPNQKWLTDITEFALPAGKVYLSPIIDCFDGMPVSWTIGTSPNAELANTMLQKAIDRLSG
ncbi:MAG: IS3 family transposase [Bacteroidia bacterium]|nr:IS3 family transposase [Bacteroidia bacterium]